MFERNPDKSIDVTADGAVALVDDFATAGEQEEISTPPMSDKRGYVKSSELEASDLAFLAPELTSEAEGPVRAPARADGRWGYRFVKRAFDIAAETGDWAKNRRREHGAAAAWSARADEVTRILGTTGLY